MTDHELRREHLISAAIAAGKFTAERAAHYRLQYDRDPAGTEQLLATLAPLPVEVSGVLGHTAATGEHSQQGLHMRPVEAPSPIPLTPDVVQGWTHDLFPETRAGAGVGDKRGRVQSDASYKRNAAA